MFCRGKCLLRQRCERRICEIRSLTIQLQPAPSCVEAQAQAPGSSQDQPNPLLRFCLISSVSRKTFPRKRGLHPKAWPHANRWDVREVMAISRAFAHDVLLEYPNEPIAGGVTHAFPPSHPQTTPWDSDETTVTTQARETPKWPSRKNKPDVFACHFWLTSLGNQEADLAQALNSMRKHGTTSSSAKNAYIIDRITFL